MNKKSWHYKIYSWFKGYEPESANLCPYVRTVFLWAPARFFFFDGFIRKIPVAAVVWPVLLFELPRWAGVFSYDLKRFIYGLYIVFGGGALIFGVVSAGDALCDRIRLSKGSHLRDLMTDAEWAFYIDYGKKAKYLPDRLKKLKLRYRVLYAVKNSLLWKYFRAAHDKVCPIIRFE